MGRIKIKDLPEDHKVSRDEMRKVFGGNLTALLPRDYIREIGFSPHDWDQKVQSMSSGRNA
jgi:hypothetical protein